MYTLVSVVVTKCCEIPLRFVTLGGNAKCFLVNEQPSILSYIPKYQNASKTAFGFSREVILQVQNEIAN
jgi:hypothetical protein